MKYAYISGWCARGSSQHDRCQTTYGKLRTLCTCKCHDAATAEFDGQAALFEVTSA